MALVPKPENKSIIRIRWVFINKLDEQGKVVTSKLRSVAQCYNQQEGICFIETFAPVAGLEVIRIMLTFIAHKNINLFQMDVKSAFLNFFIKREVYVKQPPGFEDHTLLDHVLNLEKALYGLKQETRAWYDRLSPFLLENSFMRGKV